MSLNQDNMCLNQGLKCRGILEIYRRYFRCWLILDTILGIDNRLSKISKTKLDNIGDILPIYRYYIEISAKSPINRDFHFGKKKKQIF